MYPAVRIGVAQLARQLDRLFFTQNSQRLHIITQPTHCDVRQLLFLVIVVCVLRLPRVELCGE
jgi:hypothetical protein